MRWVYQCVKCDHEFERPVRKPNEDKTMRRCPLCKTEILRIVGKKEDK